MSNPYQPPHQPQQYRPPAGHYLPPTPPEAYRPTKQYALYKTLVIAAVLAVMLAVMFLVMQESLDWLGALLVPAICVLIIGIMELFRFLVPPRPQFQFYLPPLPANPLQTAFGEGQSPFAGGQNYFGDGLGTTPFSRVNEKVELPPASPEE